jgi:hypothetical protein
VRLTIASAHRYPDLARLWYRTVARDVVPAFRRMGADVSVVLFRDAAPESFPGAWFEGATLDAPSPSCRDFLEFYDAVLLREADVLLYLDADLFLFDGGWAASHLPLFDDPTLAAVSLLARTDQPGVFALLARAAAYRALPAPALAPSYERLADWPNAVNRQPGDRAAIALRAAGRRILEVPARDAAAHLSDFHATTAIRITRERLGPLLGPRLDALIAEKLYLSMGACDNVLLGALYRALFGEPFAAGPDGVHLSGSATEETLRKAFAAITSRSDLARLAGVLARSRRALERLAAHEGVRVEIPRVVPRGRELSARGVAAARRILGRARATTERA